MALRLFFHVAGRDDVAVTASCVPRAGETAWVKSLDGERMYQIDRVEHQLDRSTAEAYGNHDVMLYCSEIVPVTEPT
jgi:hypothetical protein